jgi:diacylglycerol kinase (ATP)
VRGSLASAAILTALRVTVIYNPGSGRGRAARIAARFERALREGGHELVMRRVGAAGGGGETDLLLLLGGDGTVKFALDEAVSRRIAVYHVPLGNENLFAREFGMTRDPATLLGAMRGGRVVEMDVGVVRGRRGDDLGSGHAAERFAIMLSIGPDASVIHHMERWGREVGGHLAYLAPIAEELAAPRIVPITAEVDGMRVVDARPGLVVVANLRRYGFAINPARDADPSDGLLDLVFIPATSPGPLLLAAAFGRFGRLDRVRGVVSARGRDIRLNAPGGLAQVDGEALHLGTPMGVTVEPRALRVLAP